MLSGSYPSSDAAPDLVEAYMNGQNSELQGKALAHVLANPFIYFAPAFDGVMHRPAEHDKISEFYMARAIMDQLLNMPRDVAYSVKHKLVKNLTQNEDYVRVGVHDPKAIGDDKTSYHLVKVEDSPLLKFLYDVLFDINDGYVQCNQRELKRGCGVESIAYAKDTDPDTLLNKATVVRIRGQTAWTSPANLLHILKANEEDLDSYELDPTVLKKFATFLKTRPCPEQLEDQGDIRKWRQWFRRSGVYNKFAKALREFMDEVAARDKPYCRFLKHNQTSLDTKPPIDTLLHINYDEKEETVRQRIAHNA
jgi:hypothetical protein